VIGETWHRLSLREQRMVTVAAVVVVASIAWIGVWAPLNADIVRLSRDVPRIESLAVSARAQADDIAALARSPAPVRVDPLPAVERVLAERNLRAAVTSLDLTDGRVRMTFAMVRFDALVPLLDSLARGAGLVPADITLQPRVEPGFVRAELVLKGSK
jgi:type II secretory pathway component PulM